MSSTWCAEYAAERYDEGYERGLHDADAALILTRLLAMHETADLLRYTGPPLARWPCCSGPSMKTAPRSERPGSFTPGAWYACEASSLRAARMTALADELQTAITTLLTELGIGLPAGSHRRAGAYLVEEIAREPQQFVLSADAEALKDSFSQHLRESGAERELESWLRSLRDDPARAYQLATAWMQGLRPPLPRRSNRSFVPETVVLLLTSGIERAERSRAPRPPPKSRDCSASIPAFATGKLSIRIDEFLARLAHVPSPPRPRVPRVPEGTRHEMLEREAGHASSR